jgi:queuine tRNA-ribosyltransferase
MLAPILGTIHNLYFMNQLMKGIREAILENNLESFQKNFYENYLVKEEEL